MLLARVLSCKRWHSAKMSRSLLSIFVLFCFIVIHTFLIKLDLLTYQWWHYDIANRVTILSRSSDYSVFLPVKGLAVLAIGLSIRLVVSFCAVFGLGFTWKEHVFITLAWMPKATVQVRPACCATVRWVTPLSMKKWTSQVKRRTDSARIY